MNELHRYRMKLSEIHNDASRRARDEGYTEATRLMWAGVALHVSRAIESTRGNPVPETTPQHDARVAEMISIGDFP